MALMRRVHGRWGEVYLDSKLVAEAIGVEFTVEIDQVEVPQTGGEWLSFVEGTVRGNGTLRLVKAYSGFEKAFIDFVGKTKAELSALRDAGQPPRQQMQMDVHLDDPTSYGYEIISLNGAKFWSMTGGFALTDLVNRDWPFTFQGIKFGSRANNQPGYITPQPGHAIPIT